MREETKTTSMSRILAARPRSPNPIVTSQPAALFAEGTLKCGVIFVRYPYCFGEGIVGPIGGIDPDGNELVYIS